MEKYAEKMICFIEENEKIVNDLLQFTVIKKISKITTSVKNSISILLSHLIELLENLRDFDNIECDGETLKKIYADVCFYRKVLYSGFNHVEIKNKEHKNDAKQFYLNLNEIKKLLDSKLFKHLSSSNSDKC